MPGFMGAPPGAPPMAPPPGGPPDAKRQRREGLVLEPEEDFLQKYPGPSKVQSLVNYTKHILKICVTRHHLLPHACCMNAWSTCSRK